MWNQVIELAINNGIWAVLFVLLLIYQLKDSKSREKKYQDTIYSLNSSLTVVKDVKKDVVEIKGNVEQISVGVTNLSKKIKQVSNDVNEIGKAISFKPINGNNDGDGEFKQEKKIEVKIN